AGRRDGSLLGGTRPGRQPRRRSHIRGARPARAAWLTRSPAPTPRAPAGACWRRGAAPARGRGPPPPPPPAPPPPRPARAAPAPRGGHLLGTDTLGRDVWARLVYGARTSLFVGGLAMAVSLAVGMTAGLVAGYFGGATDAALMWVVDLVLTMPSLLLLIVLATVLPPSLLTIPLVIGAIGWTTFARTVRGEVLSLRERDYISAARALGASHARIMVRHLLPGVVPGVVVLAALGMSGAIIVDAG